jgi:ArsR family transcriptional regulator
MTSLDTTNLVTALKAAAEPTRLRILMLLAAGELNVKDLTLILGQSQPRISRHLKLLAEAGLVERFRDGSWVYFHVSDRTDGGRLTLGLLKSVDTNDPTLQRDRERSESLKREREQSAQSYFQDHAEDWDRIRSLYVAERDVEAAMLDIMGAGPFQMFVDLGTGTGRILELFAGLYDRGIGLDVNNSMLSLARARLAKSGLAHAQVRHGDIYELALADHSADAIVMHQVLHYLSEPQRAIAEAGRVLAPGGRLLIVDFAPHDCEFLRKDFAHERLGFPENLVSGWIEEAGLKARAIRHLTPNAKTDEEKLTVSIWLAERAEAAPSRPQGSKSKALERSRI